MRRSLSVCEVDEVDSQLASKHLQQFGDDSFLKRLFREIGEFLGLPPVLRLEVAVSARGLLESLHVMKWYSKRTLPMPGTR